jgi:hypothetical protein
MKNIVIIGSYPDTTFREDLLRSCIEQMRNLEMDIMLVSHYPIPTDIQASVDYVVYDKNNSMVSAECTPNVVVKSQDFVLTKFNEGHILAVSNNIINGISSADIHGYNNFIYLEYDNIFHPEDLVKLKNLLFSMRTLNKQMFYFNLIPEPIKLKFQNQTEQTFNNSCWVMHRIYEDVEYSYDVTVDGITTNFSFIMTEENKVKFIKNGFLCFLNTY